MRTIAIEKITQTVKELVIKACYELEDDVFDALINAEKKESSPRAKKLLGQLIENAQIAKNEHIPLCQDTGLAVVFVKKGKNVKFEPEDSGLYDAINRGIEQGYEQGALRKSVVAEPLNQRKNTNTNAPGVIHFEEVNGDKLEISVMAKGGGCENKSQFRMFNPTQKRQDISGWIVDVVRQAGANACPPFVVGIGIGGDFEQCCTISKRALLRKIGQLNPEPFYADMEKELLEKINNLGLGTLGLGGDTTTLAVQIETAPCHIASLPVAVNIECHSHRHKTAIL